MAMKFTPDQQKVIDLRNCNILVSAAAGSGKTAVLVQRIVELVSDAQKGTDIDRLLIVTFTNAAAAQMRERITKALSDRADAEPDNGHLKRQLTLIHNAKITTIHSFCLYLIRNHFSEIGLDPDFRTADEGEMKLLSQDVLKAVLEEQFAAQSQDFLDCVEYFAYDGRETRLEELDFKLYDLSVSYGWQKEWLSVHRSDYSIDSWQQLCRQPWFAFLHRTVAETLESCQHRTKELLALCEQPDGPYMYGTALEADLELIAELQKAAQMAWSGNAGAAGAVESCGGDAEAGGSVEDFQLLYERIKALSGRFVKLASKKDDSVSVEKRELVKKGRDKIKDALKGLGEKYFYTAPEGWLAEMQKAGPALQALLELVLLFQERLEEKKREKNLLDFHDMEHMALGILLHRQEDGSIVPSGTALEYREQFDEILIDEYQDSNLVQEYLLGSISGEEDGRFNRFMVGDVKQSIYKFRLARPELFMEKFDAYQKAEEAGQQADCVRVDLKQNFRSRHEVTDSVNDVFWQVMHRELGGVEYDEDAALYPGARFPEPEDTGTSAALPEQNGSGASVYEPEFLVALTEEEGENHRQREARMIADRIHRLVGSLPVRDHETGLMRPAKYQDIVILLRTTAGWDEEFKRILEESGIPVFVTSKTGYFAATEVQTVLNFLRILNNPLQDIPLFGVLHSVIGGFTDEEIARLRAGDGSGKQKLYDCLKQQTEEREKAAGEAAAGEAAPSLDQKCRDFLAFLNRYRSYAVYLPIHELIRQFLEETGYLYTVSALPGGSQRRINVEMLLNRAESFEKTSYSGLFHFIRYMEQLEKYNIDYGETGTIDENADIVRIMSIHKSKGLEFPICFVAGLSKKFNRQDTMQPVIMDMDLGLAIDCVDSRARTRRTTLKKNILARKLNQDSLGEELRVLYVAMTRAEEKLILTAACKEEKAGTAAIAALQDAASFYDILLPAWQAAGRPVQYLDTADFVKEELEQLAEERNARQRLELSDASQYLNREEAHRLAERMHSRYAHENLAGLFVKTTVSELKKAGMQEEAEAGAVLFQEEEVIPYLPKFVKEEAQEVTGTARGSAYHRVLELFPFERKAYAADWTAAEVAAVIQEKTDSRELTEEYARAVNPQKIAAFLQTSLAERMKKAQQLHQLRREQPFVLGISARQLQADLPAEETVLIQGIIDVFFEEDGRLVVADYKTDRVAEARELVRRYQVQLDYYAQALERLTGKQVKEKIIYSFALGEEIGL